MKMKPKTMKNKLCLLGLIFFVGSAFCQNYKPLLDNVNEWHFTTCFSGCLTDVYFTDGDTIVDNKSYKILDGYHYISRTFLLREDVASKKVYLNIVSSGQSDEYLLYDFSLAEGALFNMNNPISPFPRNGGPFLLDSIVPRPLVDGNNYRHFYFSPAPGNTVSTENAVWIEGVGSLSIINAPGGHPNINDVGHLSCYFKNTESFYVNLDSIDDCIPIQLSINNNTLETVILSKLTNTDNCVLNNTETVTEVTLFDLQGRKIRSIQNSQKISTINIDLAGYKAGIYIIKVNGFGDSVRTFKIIK